MRRPGAKIGRYLVLDTLGEGGMGVVYAAYDPELDRKVAIKILRPGRSRRDQSHAPTRLLREAQALARLSHANVVAVHDVGAHESKVFVAMEFIAGSTLADILAGGGLDQPALLRLFRGAGEGLAAAHRAGLVHRDFKPENVMVDREGRPRVVDFGLAHAVAEAELSSVDGSPADAPARLTQTGALMGTPAYMAPEQHRGQATDARTDVFAFSVALYEALYGERPFAGETLATLAAAVLDGRVREPARGSRVPARLRRVLLRGLAVDPGDRYQSMDALLVALDRAIAAPRRRALLGLAALIPLAGAATLGALTLRDPGATCRSGAQALDAIWTAPARERGARAFAASGLSYAADAWTRTDAALDAWTDAWVASRDEACDDALVRGEHSEHLLDRRLACFDRQLGALAGLVEIVGDASPAVIDRVGEVVAALPPPSACSAAALIDAGGGPTPPSAALAPAIDALRRRLSAADTRFRATFADEDLASIDAALAEARALGDLPLVAEAAESAALANMSLGRPDEAEERFLEAMSTAEASGDTRRLATVIPRWIGFLVVFRSALAEAEHASRRADALLDRIGGDEAILFRVLEARAVLRREEGDNEGSRRSLEAALEIGARVFGADDLRLADTHNNLATSLLWVDEEASAREIARAQAIWERHLGPAHPRLANALLNLARLAREREDYQEAERLFREALVRFEAIDPDHPNVGAIAHSLGQVLEYRGELDAALPLYRRALAHLQRTLGEDHISTAKAHVTLAGAEARAGDLEAALREAEIGARLHHRLRGDEHPLTPTLDAGCLSLHLQLGDLEAARALGAGLWARAERDETTPHDVLGALAELRLAEGRPAEGLELAERALARAPADSAHDYARAEVRFTLAKALVASGGDRQRARELAAAARASWSHWAAYYAKELGELAAWEAGLDTPRPRTRR
ncbi:MAG: serine/threonine protein kinase [Myxococcales bacterium]|nr:serine/threonine protein kinase [Myxococcales bacterium]